MKIYPKSSVIIHNFSIVGLISIISEMDQPCGWLVKSVIGIQTFALYGTDFSLIPVMLTTSGSDS